MLNKIFNPKTLYLIAGIAAGGSIVMIFLLYGIIPDGLKLAAIGIGVIFGAALGRKLGG